MPDLDSIREILNALPICAERHVVCERLRPGASLLRMEVPGELMEASGVPGALVFGLGDMAASFALHTTVSATDLHVTAAMTMTVRARSSSEALMAEGSVTRTGRRQAFASATVRDAAGRVCALFNGTFAIAADSPHAIARCLVDDGHPAGSRPWRPAPSTAARRITPAAEPPDSWPRGPRTEVAIRRFDSDALSRALDVRCTGIGEGAAALLMRVPGELRHPSGSVPGVIVGALAERAADLAVGVNGRGGPRSLITLDMQFIRPATGVALSARGETLGRAERDDPLEVSRSRVLDADGTPVATATATFRRDLRRTNRGRPASTGRDEAESAEARTPAGNTTTPV